ncbi:hypothetical protein MFMK1_002283 [Metallumcola ferriviriculae]|uniref:Uncharacterized protein n=1 Tax=Metallumcola ferriviriculae TaxID=3039180 RepID=A0AAU0UT63_9FIRM|nr:hypothetical protein MFMK1_002283 [Desulfitibacteraceae bacterium MK1]
MFKIFTDSLAQKRISRFQEAFAATDTMLHNHSHEDWKMSYIHSFK